MPLVSLRIMEMAVVSITLGKEVIPHWREVCLLSPEVGRL
jgi:hypothetical protein